MGIGREADRRAGVPLLIVPPMGTARQRLTPVSASDVAADPTLAEEVFP